MLFGRVWGKLDKQYDDSHMDEALERYEKIPSDETAKEFAAFKSMFLANMSHEIRTPMNVIIGFAELALHDGGISPTVKHYLTKIKESGENLLVMINNIFSVSNIESGKVKLDMVSFDLHNIFTQCEAISSIKAAEKGIELYFYAESFIKRRLIGDAVKLRQILLNLLSNAIKFTDKGMVKLFAKAEDISGKHMRILFEVEDSGIGMTPEQTEKIFHPFSQADVSAARRYDGTGIGLNICKSFVELMGGNIQVTSTKGFGSKFSFSLVFETADVPEQKKEPSSMKGNMEPPKYKADVLVCEDNEINQEVIYEQLSVVGIKPVIVNDGKLGLEAVRKRMEKPFDLIFMDIHMAGMDGLEAAAQIKKLGVKTPIIALTANAMSNDRELHLKNGMDDYLAKPVSEVDLWDCLQRYLSK